MFSSQPASQRGTWNAVNSAPPSSSSAHPPGTRNTAIPDVGYFIAIRSTASASLPYRPASPNATWLMVGSWPTTSRVATSSPTRLISAIIVPGLAP